MIEVDEQFEVAAPSGTVWAILADPYTVVECVPGAAIVTRKDENVLFTRLQLAF